MADKGDVEQFIRDMKSVSHWSKQIRGLNLDLEAVNVKLQGVASQAMKEVIYENAGDPYSNNKIELLYIEEGIQNDIQKLVDRIEEVEQVFINIENEEDFDVKQCMLDLYMCGFKYDDAIIKYNMHKSTIHRRINKSIKDAMLRLVPHKMVL